MFNSRGEQHITCFYEKVSGGAAPTLFTFKLEVGAAPTLKPKFCYGGPHGPFSLLFLKLAPNSSRVPPARARATQIPVIRFD